MNDCYVLSVDTVDFGPLPPLNFNDFSEVINYIAEYKKETAE